MSDEPSRGARVLVTGASIAGPAAAYWLDRIGYDVTVLERAPEPREGGQNIDVRGLARDVLERMDLLEAVRGAGTGEVGTAVRRRRRRDRLGVPAPTTRDRRRADRRAGDPARRARPGPARGVRRPRHLVVRRPRRRRCAGRTPRSRSTLDGGGDPRVRPPRRRRGAGLAHPRPGDDRRRRAGARPPRHVLRLGDGPAHRGRRPLVAVAERPGLALGQPAPRQPRHHPRLAQLHDRRDRPRRPRPGRAARRPARALRRRRLGGAAHPRRPRRRRRPVRRRPHPGAGAPPGAAVAWSCSATPPGASRPIGGFGTSLALIGAYVLAAQLDRAPYDEAFAAYEEWLRPLVDDVQDLPPGTPRLANPALPPGRRAVPRRHPARRHRSGTRGPGAPVQRLEHDRTLPDL